MGYEVLLSNHLEMKFIKQMENAKHCNIHSYISTIQRDLTVSTEIFRETKIFVILFSYKKKKRLKGNTRTQTAGIAGCGPVYVSSVGDQRPVLQSLENEGKGSNRMNTLLFRNKLPARQLQ